MAKREPKLKSGDDRRGSRHQCDRPGGVARGGYEARAADLAAARKLVVFVTPEIMVEYEGVLRRPKLRLAPKTVAGLKPSRTSPSSSLPTRITASPDEDDNRFISARHRRHYLVTGNRHFPVQEDDGIVRARELVELMIDAERGS